MKKPIVWEAHQCSVCGLGYPWPFGCPETRTHTCGSFDCVREAVLRDILEAQAIALIQERFRERNAGKEVG
mgnify:FL=1